MRNKTDSFDDILALVRRKGKDMIVANELFACVAAIFPPTKVSRKTKKILSHNLTRIENLALVAELCKPAEGPSELYLISRAYVYAGARFRREAIYYLEQFINHIDEYDGFPDGTVENNGGFVINQRSANIASTYSDLGECYEGEYEFDKAIKAYSYEYKLTPYYAYGIVNIARIFVKKNELPKALDILIKAKSSEFYTGSFKELLDREIDEINTKMSKGYVYRSRNKRIDSGEQIHK